MSSILQIMFFLKLAWSLNAFLYFGYHYLCAAGFVILVLRGIIEDFNELKDDG